jgi:hypothetical protein
VLRDGRPRDLHPATDIGYGPRTPAKPEEDGAARRVAQGVEDQ